jgi:hypothetical protein
MVSHMCEKQKIDDRNLSTSEGGKVQFLERGEQCSANSDLI